MKANGFAIYFVHTTTIKVLLALYAVARVRLYLVGITARLTILRSRVQRTTLPRHLRSKGQNFFRTLYIVFALVPNLHYFVIKPALDAGEPIGSI